MVLQKRLDYGFNGYRVPPTPRAARSVRKRCLFKRKTNDRQMCAFDLLATVAGKFLLDAPPANASSIEKEVKDESKQFEEKPSNQVCYERNFLGTELISEASNPNELACTQNDVISMPASVVTSSDYPEKVGSSEQLVNDDCKLSLGICPPVDNGNLSGFKKIKTEPENARHFEAGNSWHGQEARDMKPNVLVSSVDCRKDHTMHRSSVLVNRDNAKLGNRDDGEITSDCTRNKAVKLSQPAGDHRFQKSFKLNKGLNTLSYLNSKHCKATSTSKGDKHFNADMERSNDVDKNDFKCQRSPRDYPLKKRKLYSCSGSVSNSDEGISSRETDNGTSEGGVGSCPTLPGSDFSSISDQVKLKIKSFKVPELLIELPETATVGSLKQTVMEAVGSFLGGGLRVGVLLQGKRIRDDNKTLLQTGISHEDKMDSLGFTLEPTLPTTAATPSECQDKMQLESPQPLSRYPAIPSMNRNICQQQNLDTHQDLILNNSVESDHDSAPSPPGTSFQKTASESKALVPVMKQQALPGVVPLWKSKRPESAQRRIRRPFTVAEVEALVQAVEKLGTGRWRDVKLRAFDTAKHRTYVDLKDKWKTLVHTAEISPQQRRGEPVPQELLDRVMAAHAYWSKSSPDTCLLL